MKLSVCITTYNHEKYIAQAIESVLMQRTNFDYEIIIGEDDSSDNTRQIVKEYKSKYPNKITLFLNDRKNVIYIDGQPTGRWNFVNNLKNAKGEYIALLEGDDYWTDSYKLQKQADFLESHPNFAICFHWAGWLVQATGNIRSWNYGPPEIKPFYTVDDLLEHSNFIPTCSTVFRNNVPQEFPDWYYNIEVGDLPLHVMNAQKGKIGFIDEKMAVRRWHDKGMYGGNTRYNNFQKTIRSFRFLGSATKLEKRTSFELGISKLYANLSKACIEEGKYFEALITGIKSIKKAPKAYKKRSIQQLLSILNPRLSNFLSSVNQLFS